MSAGGENSENEAKRSTLKQIILGLIAYLTSIVPSMSLGFSAIALPPLQNESNPYRLDNGQASWIASIASVATPIGCFLSGPISDRFGRKAILLSINVVCVIGWAIIAVAYYVPEHQYLILLIGRFITGFSTGLASMPAAVYMAEVSSPKLRGVFTTASAVFFGLGILVVYILGFIFKEDWGTLSITTAVIPALFFFLTIAFLQESPPWLVSKNRVQEARVNLAKIYGYKDINEVIDEEIECLILNRDKSKVKASENKTFINSLKKKFKYMKKPTFVKPFFIILGFFFFMQFSGSLVVVFYAIHIVKDAHITLDPYLAIILVALTRVLTAIVVSVISRKYGRRPLSIISGAGMSICMLLLGAYISLIQKEVIDEETAKSWNLLPTFLLMAYFCSTTIGFLTIPFSMNAEVFPTKVRGLGSGLTTCFMYVFNFIVVKVYPAMKESMTTYGVFIFYGAMSLIGTVFVIIFLPETRGKTLPEIEDLFRSKRKKNDTLLNT